MGKRRANGEGSIFQLQSGKWRIQLEAPRLPGRPRRRLIRHTPTKAEAVAVLHRLRTEVGTVARDEPTLRQWLRSWLARQVGEMAENTIAQRQAAISKHLEPWAGARLVRELRPQAVDDLVRGLECGARMRQVCFDVLKMACDHAVDMEIIDRNPCKKVKRPRATRKPIHPFEPAETLRLIDACQDTRWHAFVVLCLACGTRQAELFGLEWGDVDLKAGKMTIRRQATDVSGKIHIRKPKTEAGWRVIDLPAKAAEALAGHRATLMREGLAGSKLVFLAPRGGYSSRGNFRVRFWKPLLVGLGLRHRGAHHLRHTYATLALGAGIPAHVVSKMLGHARVSTTLDLYAHAIPSQQAEAAAVMNRLLG